MRGCAREWWQELAGLVLPAGCAGCGAARQVLCAGCRAALSGARAGPVRPDVRRARRAGPEGLPAVCAGARYEGAVRAVVLAHKERGALPLAGPLGGALAAAVLQAGTGRAGGGGAVGADGELALVPVPSARRTVRARGHDPARRIALAASGRLRRAGTAARVAPVLRLRRAVADQAGLGARERLENLAGALEVCPGGARLTAGARIVLVDDVITTGATLAEAARALRAAGLGVGAAAVVAAPAESFVEAGSYGRIRSATRTGQKSCE
ncbi:phosphoribosyltransferase family protein [Streptomyces sp. NBC_00249]|uniref:ComF family protein n=1 Tax=Streptomyces sp. NBC_00249 TaxID=2975690 RepID=UPI0022501F22|nr:phosphoribosyltransferase family protein [Streptomyces sp. NBC_00249]MCX5199673.1 phosphoribosyltransferase family protein [Streptomyces sp. NBC_00249]